MPGPVMIEKAQFLEYDGDSPKTGTAIPVQFNPNTLSVKMKQATAATGAAVPNLEMGSSLTVDLVFDSTRQAAEPRDVQEQARKLFQLLLPIAGTGTASQRPKKVGFCWGKFLFIGIVTGFEETLEFFSADGTPLRSKVKVSMSREDAHWTAARSQPVTLQVSSDQD
ncbi:MAG TPA: hypothetical protein VNT75_12435 [Symbiobacteriaceae bacterium]|nr:hypothetical protein [Symbiobacteriaceae bacterium]